MATRFYQFLHGTFVSILSSMALGICYGGVLGIMVFMALKGFKAFAKPLYYAMIFIVAISSLFLIASIVSPSRGVTGPLLMGMTHCFFAALLVTTTIACLVDNRKVLDAIEMHWDDEILGPERDLIEKWFKCCGFKEFGSGYSIKCGNSPRPCQLKFADLSKKLSLLMALVYIALLAGHIFGAIETFWQVYRHNHK
jgi:hypothetical protein